MPDSRHEGAGRERHLLVESADYWFQNSRDQSYSLAERMLWLENALNHTENTLIAIVEDSQSEHAAKLRERLQEMRQTPRPIAPRRGEP